MIESSIRQRLVGLLVFLGGAGFTAWEWYTVIAEGYYHREAAAMFPGIAVAGLGMLLFPMDVERLRAEHGVDKPEKFSHYPPAWKGVIVVGILAGVGNWIAIANW